MTRKDYWVSATVRTLDSMPGSGYWLWTRRIQAPTLSQARERAIELMRAGRYEYGQLNILWDDELPEVV
jgi:hypothetical protein